MGIYIGMQRSNFEIQMNVTSFWMLNICRLDTSTLL